MKHITSEELDAMFPSIWEMAAQLIWGISAPVAASQTVLWFAGLSQRPRFTAIVALLAWLGFIGGLTWWLSLRRHRKRSGLKSQSSE